MSGNVKTINSSNQDNLVYEEWHKDHRRFIAHCLKTGKFSDVHSRFLLLGTPNVGKSTFFNKLTTATAMVSNIDRLTVADTLGRFKSNKAYVLIDLPGIYNLSHPIDEESVVAHEILHDHYQKIVNIVGAQSLARDLLLTIQSIEVGKLSTLVVNMTDEVTSGVIDYKKLSKLLNNVSVVPTQANRGLGIKEAETSLINDQTVSPVIVKYSPLIEKLIMKISHILPSIIPAKRFYALMILEKNQYVLDRIKKYFNQEYQSINKLLTQYKKHDFYQEIYQIRKKKIASIVNQVVNHSLPYLTVDKVRQHKIDRILLNKPIGITLFFLMVMAIYYISFGPYTGGYLQSQLDWFLNDKLAGEWISALFTHGFGSNQWVSEFFTVGILGGFFTVITFIPIIGIMFILVNLIQQIGVLSRISVLLDQALDRFGISGRSIINLLIGFGCNVPAILMARSANSRKERWISILIAPFVVCSARVIVVSFVCNLIFSAQWGWIAMISINIGGGMFALFIGLVFSKTLFRKHKTFFIIEMVDWRRPDFAVILKSVWLQIREFIKKAAIFIMGASVIIWLLLHLGVRGQVLLGDENIDQSVLASVAKGINFMMYPVGFFQDTHDGWKLTISLISAMPAKEIALANLGMLFPDNSLTVFFTTHIAMAMSYLIIFTVYIPCSATIATMVKEGSWKMATTHIVISLSSAYILGIIVYWLTRLCLL